MRVITSRESYIQFDNGLEVIGDGDIDCCAENYLDCEQLPVGTELDDMDIHAFAQAMIVKDDGFSIKDKSGVPKWVQARSDQNGYYSNITTLILQQNDQKIIIAELSGEEV